MFSMVGWYGRQGTQVKWILSTNCGRFGTHCLYIMLKMTKVILSADQIFSQKISNINKYQKDVEFIQ